MKPKKIRIRVTRQQLGRCNRGWRYIHLTSHTGREWLEACCQKKAPCALHDGTEEQGESPWW